MSAPSPRALVSANTAAAPRPPRPRRAPKLRKHPRSGYYYSVFYDPARRPTRTWFALQTDQKRRAMKLHQQADEAWFAGTFDPWRGGRPGLVHVPVATAIERYASAQLADGAWRPKTEANRRDVLGRFAATLPAGLGPEHVRAADVAAFIDAPPAARPKKGTKGGALNVADPTRQKRAPGTRRTYLSTLHHFFEWCISAGYAEANPTAGVKVPASDVRAPVHLRPEHVLQLVRAVHAEVITKQATGKMRTGTVVGAGGRPVVWIADFIELAAYTALRPSEIARLRWRDVDVKGRTLYVRNTDAGRTKTGEERAVALAAPAVEVLHRLAAARASENPDHPVITGGRGPDVPVSVAAASHLFRRFARGAGLPDGVTLYALRRTLPTWLASAGVTTAVASRILGHKNSRTTERHYADVWDDSTRAELDRAVRSVFAGIDSGDPPRPAV